MKDEDWAVVVGCLAGFWPHQLVPEESLILWRQTLDDLVGEQVKAGIESLYRTGREYPPNGAQIRLEVLRLSMDAPEWSEVWSTICNGIGRFSMERQVEMRAEMEALSPLCVVLFDRIDWREFRFSEDPMTVKEAQVRGKWEGLVADQTRQGALQGLPSAGLAELERVNTAPRRLAMDRTLRAIEGGNETS